MEDWIIFAHELRRWQGRTNELNPSQELIDEVRANYHNYEYRTPYLKELIECPARERDEVFAVLEIRREPNRWLSDGSMLVDATKGLVWGHSKRLSKERIVVSCFAACRAKLASGIQRFRDLTIDYDEGFYGVSFKVLYITPTYRNIGPTLKAHQDEFGMRYCDPFCVVASKRAGDKLFVPLVITIHDPDADLREFDQRVRAIRGPCFHWATSIHTQLGRLVIACVVDDREMLGLMLESISELGRSLKVDTLGMYSISYESTARR